jgi:hypothetical protein
MPFHRFDRCIERAQVEALHEGPHETSPVVGAKEAIEIDRTKLELTPVRKLEPRCSCRLLALVWLNGRKIEEGVVHAENRSCDEPAWESLQPKDSQALSRVRHACAPHLADPDQPADAAATQPYDALVRVASSGWVPSSLSPTVVSLH